MACLCLLLCLFFVTFELGHTDAIGDNDCTAKILDLSKMLVKLESLIEEMSSRLETEVYYLNVIQLRIHVDMIKVVYCK